MSTTFSVADLEVLGYALVCACGNTQTDPGFLYPSYAEALIALQNGVTMVCGDEYCAAYNTHVSVQVEGSPEVNVSNTNARELFTVLGMLEESFDYSCGSMVASDFLGRILMALAVNQEVGVPVTESFSPSGVRFVDCGREDGYVEAKLIVLQEVAEQAVKVSRKVQWG